jgi:folate-binding protein YgfZ
MNGLESMVELAGQNVVLSYSGIESEYDALHRRAIVVNRSHRARMRFVGEKAADVLSGLVTNDVTALLPGQGQYAAALSPKGRVVADLRILRLEDGFLTDVSARARDGWFNIVRKYVNPRLARYSDESSVLQSVGVFGVQARHIVEQMTGIGHSALSLLQPYAQATITVDGVPTIVMRSPELGVEGYELIFPAERYATVWDAAMTARAIPGGLAVWEVARVEAGRPEWGIDMDEGTIAQEANLEQLNAISFTKGCYTGQEVVARVHFRGHVNRALRGIRAAGSTPVPARASLFDATQKAVGDVRSSVVSPRHGAIALAMVRVGIEDGTPLTARWSADSAGDAPAGECGVDVVPLPFATL